MSAMRVVKAKVAQPQKMGAPAGLEAETQMQSGTSTDRRMRPNAYKIVLLGRRQDDTRAK